MGAAAPAGSVMRTFEILVTLLLAGAARFFGAPYPAPVALGGSALAFVPGMPAWRSIWSWRAGLRSGASRASAIASTTTVTSSTGRS